ncbi:methyltransferase domain-containing protein [Streptomyces sp. 4N509B]|uniref:methyltransferase domain-containing protein n=1 Tax=Streptomyces sp. 4N509B TaxID=3457413 RepID=UPI003FD6ABDB
MVSTQTQADTLRRQLADRLTNAGDPWHHAFHQVPRHRLLEEFAVYDHVWRIPEPMSRTWLEYVYSDAELVSRLDDQGHPVPLATHPSLLLVLLHALDVDEGNHVLHVGTGTGYAPALLAHRLGDRVTTVEVDPARALQASRAITAVGYHPHVVTGDGHLGAEADAPFHRVLATGRTAWLPPAWIAQTLDGGLIVTPLGRGVARLRVSGEQATGRFLPEPVDVPPLVTPAAPGLPPPEVDLQDATPENTDLDISRLLDDLAVPLSLALPDHTLDVTRDDDGEIAQVRISTRDGSAVLIEATGRVWQVGPRRLQPVVDEVAGLVPAHLKDFGITVTPRDQRTWYGAPDGPSWRLSLPSPSANL